MYYEQLLYDLLLYTVLLVGIAIIILIALRTVERWKVKVEIDDGRIIRYVNAKEKGRVARDGRTFVLIEYYDKANRRKVEALVPDHPDYMRIMNFASGLVKAVVYRVDTSGNPLPFTMGENIVVPADAMQYIKTHEMLINALRTRLVFKNLMLYIIAVIIIVMVFAGLVIWLSMSRPIQVIVENIPSQPPQPPIG